MRRIISVFLVVLLSVAFITLGQSAAQVNGTRKVSDFIGIADNSSRHVTMLRDLAVARSVNTDVSNQLLLDGDILLADAKLFLEMQDIDAAISTTKQAMSKFLQALDNLKESFAEAQNEEEVRILDSLERQKLRMIAIRRAVGAARDVPEDIVSDIDARIAEVERRHSAVSRDGMLAIDRDQAAIDLENARVNQDLIVDALRDQEFQKIIERYQLFIITVEAEIEKIGSVLQRAKGADIDVSRLEARVDRAILLLKEIKQNVMVGELEEAKVQLFLLREMVETLRTDISNLSDGALRVRVGN